MTDASTIDPVEQVTALLQRSQLAEAIQAARDALDRGVEAPVLLNLRAYWLEGENRPGEALSDLQRAHEMAPTDPIVLNALGLCLAKLGRLEEANAAFRHCVALAPEFAPAHFNCGWTFEELGELDEAQQAFEAAARIDPRSPDSMGRLAALAARRGRWSDTRALAEKALVLAPLHPAATMALANAEISAKSYDDAKTRLRALIDSPQVSEQDRATAVGLFADVLDAQARYQEAFAAYSASNALFKSAFAGRLAARAEMPMSKYVAWLLESFESAAMPQWPPAGTRTQPQGNAPRRHIFVLGFPRSGTTLLEEVLACHPTVSTTGEKDAFAGIARELLANPARLAQLKALGPADVTAFRQKYWNVLRGFGISFEDRILVDKQPFNSVRLPLIAKLFPEARIVFCLRDPRDVVLSCFRRRFSANAANAEFLTLDGTAKLYDAVMRLVAVYRAKLPLACHELRNEDLVADFDGQLRALCTFMDVEWTEEFRNFAARSGGRQVITPSATQIQRGLGGESIGHWREYEADMAAVLPLLNGWAKQLNYNAN